MQRNWVVFGEIGDRRKWMVFVTILLKQLRSIRCQHGSLLVRHAIIIHTICDPFSKVAHVIVKPLLDFLVLARALPGCYSQPLPVYDFRLCSASPESRNKLARYFAGAYPGLPRLRFLGQTGLVLEQACSWKKIFKNTQVWSWWDFWASLKSSPKTGLKISC